MSETTVLLLDDHRMLREGTAALLAGDPSFRVVAEAGTLAEALERCRMLSPALALVDVCLPDGSGFDFLRRVSAWRARPRSVVLSGFDEAAYPRVAAELGAAGYVSKSAAGGELLEALHRVRGGRTVFPAGVLDRPGAVPAAVVAPTRREREVLREIGSGASTAVIAARLHVSERTVHFHVGNLFAKLGVHSRLEAVARGREAGWLTP